MKRIICCILSAILLLSLSACTFSEPSEKKPVTFYYQRSEFQFHTPDGVIASEQREVAGHDNDCYYLITLYLMGPLDETLASPFPAGTKLIGLEQKEQSITVTLSNEAESLNDARYSLAISCLGLTCMEITDAEEITVNCGIRTNTITRDSFILTDSEAADNIEENGGTQ